MINFPPLSKKWSHLEATKLILLLVLLYILIGIFLSLLGINLGKSIIRLLLFFIGLFWAYFIYKLVSKRKGSTKHKILLPFLTVALATQSILLFPYLWILLIYYGGKTKKD